MEVKNAETKKLNLSEIEKISVESAETVINWEKTLIVAPHADDESLGCGGAIALLRKFEIEVSILLVSDGTLSHPNSQKYPREKLRELREKELSEAAQILGVDAENITCFHYQDRAVPNADAPEFSAAVERCRQLLESTKPQTICVPWRRDPHPDHRAAFQLIERAKTNQHKILEYPIWLYELAKSDDAPLENEVSAFRLDISSVVETKQRAIHAHQSQITNLIDDDPNGFRLSEEVLENFAVPFEIYFKEKL